MATTATSLRSRVWGWAATLVLGGCGGGELLLLTVVTPLNGQWTDSAAGSSLAFQFRNLDPTAYLYDPKLTVSGVLINPGGVCAGDVDTDGNLPLTGTLDNGSVQLNGVQSGQPCIAGRFTDLRRLEASVGPGRVAKVFENSRIDMQLTEGIWVSEGGGAVRLKFDNGVGNASANDSIDNGQTGEVGACDASPGTTAVRLTGTIAGFGVNGIKNPTIDALSVENLGTVRFRDVVFKDGATLTLQTAAGQGVTLRRQKEAVASSCL